MINYVNKKEIYPSFGLYKDGEIKIREDLPKRMKDFLLIHETYHSTDKETVWWKREIKANLCGAFGCPLGFLMTMFYSLSLYRLKYYFQRIQKGE